MSLPCLKRKWHFTAILLVGCCWMAPLRTFAQQSDYLPASQSGPAFVPVSTNFPGHGSPPPPDPRLKVYEGNSYYINEGHRLFIWYNCVGCHSNGGGGMGPALMDGHWIYGGKLDQIYASIAQGRPNGMPSWGRKIPDGQIWELAAFVKSLSIPASTSGGSAQSHPVPPPAMSAHGVD